MFDNHFEVFLADTPESKEIHYAIRYQVYCEEMEFANKDDFPQKLERDVYDNFSSHFIIRHIHTGQWIGAMRLIFRKGELLFPMEKHCTFSEYTDLNLFNQSVELSRLCVIKEIRRGYTETAALYGMPYADNDIKVVRSHNSNNINQALRRRIIFGILKAASEYCYNNDIKDWYFLTTASLSKILRKGGLNVLRVGESCYHYGERYPFKMDAIETYHNVAAWKDDYKKSYRHFSKASFQDLITSFH